MKKLKHIEFDWFNWDDENPDEINDTFEKAIEPLLNKEYNKDFDFYAEINKNLPDGFMDKFEFVIERVDFYGDKKKTTDEDRFYGEIRKNFIKQLKK